jgi:hypothetical protein
MAWVVGPDAGANRQGIQTIIEKALSWELRNGATFEAEKTAVIHFTRMAWRANDTPFTINGQTIHPKEQVKSWESSWTNNSGTSNTSPERRPRVSVQRWISDVYEAWHQPWPGAFLWRQLRQ